MNRAGCTFLLRLWRLQSDRTAGMFGPVDDWARAGAENIVVFAAIFWAGVRLKGDV